jgi:hypothetical protein
MIMRQTDVNQQDCADEMRGQHGECHVSKINRAAMTVNITRA